MKKHACKSAVFCEIYFAEQVTPLVSESRNKSQETVGLKQLTTTKLKSLKGFCNAQLGHMRGKVVKNTFTISLNSQKLLP